MVTSWNLQMRSLVLCHMRNRTNEPLLFDHTSSRFPDETATQAGRFAGEHMGSHLTPLELIPWEELMQPTLLNSLLGM